MINYFIDGQEVLSIVRSSLSDSIDEFAGSFSFVLHENIGVKPGDLCVVTVDGEKRLTGYIDKGETSYTTDTHEITYTGRSKTADVIDSSISGLSITQATSLVDAIQEVLNDIGSGLSVIDLAETDKFEDFEKVTGEYGESAFDVISKYCRKRQVLLTSDEEGNIVLTRGVASNSDISISNSETGNIISASGIHTLENRYHKYEVGSQEGDKAFNFSGETSAKAISSKFGLIQDDQIRPSRVLRIVAESSSNAEDCEARADWKAKIARSRSIGYKAKVAFHNQDGEVYKKGILIRIDDPFVFDETVSMLVKKVVFTQGDESTTELEFAPEGTYSVIASEPARIEKKDTFLF